MSRSSFPRRPASEGREILEGLWRRSFSTVRGTLGLLLIAFALGIAIWVFVTEEENPTRSGLFPGRIEVQAVNVGADIAVANVLPTVDVRIEARDDRWDDLTTANFRAIVDLNGLTSREQTVPIRVEVDDARGVRVIAVEPPAITVNLEDIVTRIVRVEPRLVGALPRGFVARDAVPARLTVEVSGPENLVDLVVSAGADVNVTGLTVGLSQTLQLVARGAGGGEIRGVSIDPPDIRIDVEIEQTTLTRVVPLDVELVGEPAPGYRVSGVQIQPGVFTIEGEFDALQSVDGLSLGQVLLDGVRENLSVMLTPSLPPGVNAAAPGEIEVIISIAAIQGSTIVTVVPELVGVPEGLSGDLGEQLVTVVLDGAIPVLNALIAGDIRAEVDVSGLEEGASPVVVRIVAPSEVSVREVRPSELTVTLEPAPTEGEG